MGEYEKEQRLYLHSDHCIFKHISILFYSAHPVVPGLLLCGVVTLRSVFALPHVLSVLIEHLSMEARVSLELMFIVLTSPQLWKFCLHISLEALLQD